MRARAGDPPRTMPQKIVAGRTSDPTLSQTLIPVKVDQVVITKAAGRVLGEALNAGLKRTPVEVAVAYDTTCVTSGASLQELKQAGPTSVSPDLPLHNILVARPGIGFPGPVHVERFAAPARLALTDEPRLASVGGIGMLALVATPAQLGEALATGTVWLRPPRSIQIHLSGRLRPFVCARDVSLELMRRGLSETVARIERELAGPVVLEFAGPSARLLSVSERCVLASIAPHVGASAALFVSDEKTEVFLRDQRRSKAHRALVPDPGAPCEEVITVDLGTIDPLLMDETGVVRGIREISGKPVSQVILGGDSGTTLRDMLATAVLLKSKRVPSRLDFIIAPPSRQTIEVLAQTGALVDLVATGARIIEPDYRVTTGEFYPPPATGLSLRTADPEPRTAGTPGAMVASAETLAYAVATGNLGDPRAFKRPVRVSVPRALPTDDVLVQRDKKGDAGGATKVSPTPGERRSWGAPTTLKVAATAQAMAKVSGPLALALTSPDELRAATDVRVLLQSNLWAVIAPAVPTMLVTALSAEGIAVFEASTEVTETLAKSETLELGPASTWDSTVAIQAGGDSHSVTWLAKSHEREWVLAGGPRKKAAATK